MSMQTANGLTIDERGTVEAERIEDGQTRELRWGKVDDPDADDYQDTLGIEDGEWVRNDEDEGGNYYVYAIDGAEYRVYQADLIGD